MSEFMDTVKCLEDMCVNLNYRQEKIILAGDFNAHLFDTRSGQLENDKGKIVLHMCIKLGLFPANVDMSCKGQLFTCVSGCGKSVVDYICLSNCMRTNVNCIEVVDKINVDGNITDEKIFSKSGREYERIAWRKCTLEHYSEFQWRLNDAVVQVDDTLSNADDIDHYYSLLCQCVKKSDECLPRIRYKQFVKPYWNNELKQLQSTCMEYHRWCLEGHPRGEQFESFQLHNNAKHLFRKEQRRLSVSLRKIILKN